MLYVSSKAHFIFQLWEDEMNQAIIVGNYSRWLRAIRDHCETWDKPLAILLPAVPGAVAERIVGPRTIVKPSVYIVEAWASEFYSSNRGFNAREDSGAGAGGHCGCHHIRR